MERSRKWVKTSVATETLSPRKEHLLQGVEEAALMAVGNTHQKAAGERLRQMEAKSKDRYSRDQGRQDWVYAWMGCKVKTTYSV